MSAVSTVHRLSQVNTVQVEKGNTHATDVGKKCIGLRVYRRLALCVYTKSFGAAGWSAEPRRP